MNKMITVGIIDPVGGHADNFYNYGLAIGLTQNDVAVYYFTSCSTDEIKKDSIVTNFAFSNIWAQKSKARKFLKYINGLFRIFRYSKKVKIKILHFMVFHIDLLMVLGVLLSKVKAYKIIVTMHDVENFAGKKLPKWIENIFYSLIDRVIVHNEFSFKEIKKAHPCVDCNIVNHGNYIPFIKKVNPQKINASLNILFFGQIKKVKGLDILLKAVGILKLKNVNIKLTVAGKMWKDNFLSYKALINELDIEKMVDLNIGYIPNEKVWDYFNNANIVVLPYKKIYQSGVLLMAMSYGRLVLTSNIEAFSVVIEDGINGFLFENGNEESLADKLILLSGKMNTFNAIEENAFSFVEKNYNWNQSALKTKELYLSI